MRVLAGSMIICLLLAGCSEDGREATARFYASNKKGLEDLQEVNNFSLQLAYMPPAVLPGLNDTGYYHFRLQVQCPVSNASFTGDKTALYYGLDSLFAAGGNNESIYPVSVEPVITGSNNHFEYLLVFVKKDLKTGDRLEIIFYDRLFTNTKMSFVFDRTKIDEIDLLHCQAHDPQNQMP